MTPSHKTIRSKQRSPLRRKSKSPLRKAIDRADRALQDWYRAKYPDEKCEACGKGFQIIHHFIEKSRSAYLRYNEINLIFICNSCHALHHQFHDSRVMARVIIKRGAGWLSKLMELSKEKGQINQYVAEEIIKKYEL